MSDFLDKLRTLVPADRIVTDPDVISSYARDQAAWAPVGTAAALVRAGSTEDVRNVVAVCAEHGVPVVPRGAGTGVCGGANALDGCVLLSLETMTEIVEINEAERLAVVQPGVVNDVLRQACAERGLWYPPDPSSAPWSTIGGNVATNAGGLCCVKYGVTRDYVLAVEAVVGRGEVVRLGRRTAKGVAGYDLCGLMVGSEGTLGVITEVTVRLRGARAPERTIVGYFDTLQDAGEAVAKVTAAGLMPSALELVDRHVLEAVDAWRNMGLSADANVLLLARSDQPGEAGEAEADAMVRLFEEAGATWSARSTDEDEAEALFAARRLSHQALERLGSLLTEDVCVPRGLLPEMLSRVEAAAAENDTRIANVAHAGDGNLHPVIIIPPGDDAARVRAERAFDQIIAGAIALGGTIAGEHGIGLLKRRGLRDELDPAVIAMHHAVKNALDPAGIFNPGKVFG
ncbi:FAD-linked oxidase C-terminal domain-containing protein [Actinomadura meridiana]|uniref:FAD-linked oxidase C-terminal domain-containing protein n=1 Tax=Actinomadura meridiana TaxID=559626 RepID=A0ABP8CDP9_9ACTN